LGRGCSFIPQKKTVNNNNWTRKLSAAEEDRDDGNVPSSSVNGQRKRDFSGEGGRRGGRGGCVGYSRDERGGFRGQNSDENDTGFKKGKLFLFVHNIVWPSIKQPARRQNVGVCAHLQDIS
jgi:hypothetical protein